MSKKTPAGPGGLVIVDKQAGMTSHDVVARLRRIVGTRRVGHAGTLDPMATGVLVLGVERATKLLNHLVLTDKSYTATIRLGASTTTDDAEGPTIGGGVASGLSRTDIGAAMLPLTGDIRQRPAAVSAIKVDGQRSYARVRAGETVELASRPVTVRRFEMTTEPRRIDRFCDVDVLVDCSSGTYVRALARDLGAALGVGGHLTALRRIRVGPFRIENALSLDDLAASDNPIMLRLPQAIEATMPVRRLTIEEVRELSFGRTIAAAGIAAQTYGGIAPSGEAVALLQESAGLARPVLGFMPAG